MIVLKSQKFGNAETLALFVNKNNIKREDILAITTLSHPISKQYLYYYADSETEEVTKGIFGWSD